MKRLSAFMLALVLVGACFSGCGSKKEEAYVPTGRALYVEGQDLEEYLAEEKEPQELSLAYYPDRSMNPLIGNNITNRVLFSLMYQGLFATDRNNEPHPILCSAYQVSPSNMVYTYYLDSSAAFSDGTKVTINDVLATYQAAQTSDYYGGRFTHVTSMELSNDGGITFTLSTPYEDFSMLLDIPILKATELEAEHPLGTGPYSFSEGISGAHLSKVRDWWCGTEISATADSITLVVTADQAQIRDEFEFGDVGLACANPMSDSYAEYRCDYELWEIETGLMGYLGCNLESGVFSNDKVRAALTYAIDRTKILQQCYNGFGAVTTLAVPPNSPFYDKGLGSQGTYSPEKFRQVIKDEGLLGTEVVLLVNKSDSVRLQAARMIVSMLEEGGLTVTLEDWSTPYYKNKLTTDEWDLYLGQTKLSATMDLSQFFAPYGALSYGDMDDAACYSMAHEALENSGNFYNLHQLIKSDGQLVPILFRTYAVYAKRGLVDNLDPSRDNVFFYTLGKTLEDAMTIDYGEE